MRLRFVPLMPALILWAAVPSFSQKRLADGHPDLQGIYDLATLTPLDRPAGQELVLTKEQAEKIEANAKKLRDTGDAAIKGDRTAPPKGGDGSVGAAGNVGGYNYGWLDPGSSYTVVNGEKRSSIVVDPPNGRVPPFIPAALQRMAGLRSRPTSDAAESRDPGLEPPGSYDDPE